MNIQISDTSSVRSSVSTSSAPKPVTEIDESTPFSQLLRSKEIAGDIAAVVAKNSILTQAEKSLMVQANTTTDVALSLLK
jgi:uncharacterized 2Fe-2S/4Fe-4S cluster protein (DUF4445 family)